MRITLSLDDDVADLLKRVQTARQVSFKEVVNSALREGLRKLDEPRPVRLPYRTGTHDPGECFFPNLDNTQEILDVVTPS